ncbi:MAG: type II secretion system ATPase GspE [Pseudomonadota bacterium]
MDDQPHASLTYAFAREHGVLPLGLVEGGAASAVRLGVRGEARPEAILEARRVIGRPLRLETLAPAEFERRLSESFTVEGIGSSDIADDLDAQDDLGALVDDIPQTADLLEADDDAPIIRLINAMISEAIKLKASDIHVEPYETALIVRLRVDGVLQEAVTLSHRVAPLLVSRIKVMARLDIAEKRVPQDGRISLSLGGKTVDVRVSTLPSRYGERVVMRLLDKEQARLDLDQLGMASATLGGFRKALTRPNGVILVTGPTGSGKTTTLYAGLTLLNDRSRNILTVEDPIEYAIEGVGQTQVNAKVGMSFAAGLRAILRQDPDVVMVGEIRDVETAQIAVQASLTGHLVMSTVHTNSAVGAITRLRDMGVEPFLLASTVVGILAQRLVRALCPHCKTPATPTEEERRLLGVGGDEETQIFRAAGCPKCNHAGYVGRLGIYELVLIDDELRRLIHGDASEQAMAEHAFKKADTLARSGFAHVLAGRTSIEEVLRVSRQDDDAAEAS